MGHYTMDISDWDWWRGPAIQLLVEHEMWIVIGEWLRMQYSLVVINVCIGQYGFPAIKSNTRN
jgi:hypothetical protein